ncbi:MAG: hypothetical protein KGJ21_00365 [Pseudomonadota bacterium]|nr:hypothetical protein [Pseudomonadota bacterium]
MPQLDPTWYPSQLFWLAITFVAFYFIMSRLVLPPLQHIAAYRKQTIGDDIAQAQRLKTQAEQARVEYERTLAHARDHVRQIMAESEAAHKAAAEAAGKEMDKQVEKTLAEAEKRIAGKKRELVAGLAPTASDLTALIIEKLTRKKLESAQVTRIMNELAKAGR